MRVVVQQWPPEASFGGAEKDAPGKHERARAQQILLKGSLENAEKVPRSEARALIYSRY